MIIQNLVKLVSLYDNLPFVFECFMTYNTPSSAEKKIYIYRESTEPQSRQAAKMRVTIVYLATIFPFWFPTLCVSTASDKRWGEKLYGYVASLRTGSGTAVVAMVRSSRDALVYGRVPLRPPTSKPTSSYLNAKVVSSNSKIT